MRITRRAPVNDRDEPRGLGRLASSLAHGTEFFHSRSTPSRLEREVHRVLRNENCSGCGVCALVSDRIQIDLDREGFARPWVRPCTSREHDRSEAAAFVAVCPGAKLRAPSTVDGRWHSVFGSYLQAWEGSAVDSEFRRAGASGGVLSALAFWLVSSGRAKAVTSSAMSNSQPTRTVPVRIRSRDEALASAGSRYAPVVSVFPCDDSDVFIGKPCEVAGRAQLAAPAVGISAQKPVLLSFFCAGTPSQNATDKLVESLGVEPDDVASLRYRGNGWPGQFEVRSRDGRVRTMSYQESWGRNLGRTVQPRCKLCPDGTGEYADVAVGDYWAADDQGFPIFSEADGNSVIIARTPRGAALIAVAAAQGIIDIKPLDLDNVAAVQPLQTKRRETLPGRLIGRRLAGYRVPTYRGYRMFSRVLSHPLANLRAAAGTFARSTRLRRE
ncbi:Coenzyme F420 hydrogenase/dehydrogenase, beta subunit C-terminal domain [Mycolicibacterium elephantis]